MTVIVLFAKIAILANSLLSEFDTKQEGDMNTKTISSTQAQNNFGRILDDITQNNTRYVVKRRDTPQVILLSVSDFQALLVNQSEQDKLGKIIRELRPAYHLGETVE